MKKLLRLAAIAVTGLGLTTGVAAASTGSIGNTGPRSDNTVTERRDRDVDVDNNNDVRVDNRNDQNARTGNARVSGNATGGGARSGAADNDYLSDTAVEVDNSASTAGAFDDGNGDGDNSGTINTTGPRSDNHIFFNSDVDVDIDNDNDVYVENDVDQRAVSGNARVSGNTTGGGATSGNASNISTTTTTVNVSN